MVLRIVALGLSFSAFARADVVVNAPLPITHRVQVQPIIVRNEAGTTAVFFGGTSEEAYIKGQIDAIWAQAGVRVEWLAPVSYTSGFALDGAPANYNSAARPSGEFTTILNGAGSPPKHPNGIVLNAFFVDIVPAFSRTGPYTANGYARIDANGMAMHVGDALPGFPAGRDLIAGVVAHEIGHNLGLDHTGNGGDNLMSPNGTADRLDASQRSAVFANHGGIDGYDFLQPVPAATNYGLWAAGLRLSGGPGDDEDGDGVPNVVEFMLGLQGRRADDLPAPLATPGGVTWTLPKVAGALADGLVYAVEVSADGLEWAPAGSAGSGSAVVADTDGTLAVASSEGSGMLRLTAAIPPALSGDAETFVPLALAAELEAGRVIRERACAGGECPP